MHLEDCTLGYIHLVYSNSKFNAFNCEIKPGQLFS